MPIRTHRGRAAVYRRLWGWPLRSPKHLGVAVVLLVAVASAVGLLLPEPPPREARAGERVTVTDPRDTPSESTTRSGEDSAAPPTISVPTQPPAQVPPDRKGLAVVRNWARSWVTHPPGTTSQQWLDGLRPYTTDEFITVMTTIDPANVPATKVTGPPEARRSTRTSMRVMLPTNGGTLRVHAVRTSEGWRVAGYDKVA